MKKKNVWNELLNALTEDATGVHTPNTIERLDDVYKNMINFIYTNLLRIREHTPPHPLPCATHEQ